MIEFIPYSEEALLQFTALRNGEVKLGEVCRGNTTQYASKQFYVIGVSEDVGPQLNGGRPGANKAFDAFLPRFLSVQSNSFLKGDNIHVLGKIVPDQQFNSTENQLLFIQSLDEYLARLVQDIVSAGGIPIVIGGGHNNAFPLIKGVFQALNVPISVVNLDPHADLRETSFRHSGNGFSTAFEQGFLKTYVPFGLHESYNNQFILDFINKHDCKPFYFESWLDDPNQFYVDLKSVANLLQNVPTGIELDMDAIAYMPSSAYTPSGVSVNEARQYVRKLAVSSTIKYIHFPEAAPSSKEEEAIVGKTLAYLVTDFIKVHSNAF